MTATAPARRAPARRTDPTVAQRAALAQTLVDALSTGAAGWPCGMAIDVMLTALVTHWVNAGLGPDEWDRNAVPIVRDAIVERRAERLHPEGGRC